MSAKQRKPLRERVEYADIIQSELFREFFDVIKNVLGIQMAFMDSENKSVTRIFPIERQNNICSLVRTCRDGFQACKETDARHFDKAIRTKRGQCYICHAGLIDFMEPVFINGSHVATFNGGQVLPAPPNEHGFQAMSERLKDFDIDPDRLRDAYYKTPWLSRVKTESVLRLIGMFAELVLEKGFRLKSAQKKTASRHPRGVDIYKPQFPQANHPNPSGLNGLAFNVLFWGTLP